MEASKKILASKSKIYIMKKFLSSFVLFFFFSNSFVFAQKSIGISINAGYGMHSPFLKSNNINDLSVINFDNVKVNYLGSKQFNLLFDLKLLKQKRFESNINFGLQASSSPLEFSILVPKSGDYPLIKEVLQIKSFEIPLNIDFKYAISPSQETKVLLRVGTYMGFNKNYSLNYNNTSTLQPNMYQVQSYGVNYVNNGVNITGVLGAGVEIDISKKSSIVLMGSIHRGLNKQNSIKGKAIIGGAENLSYDFTNNTTIISSSKGYIQVGYTYKL